MEKVLKYERRLKWTLWFYHGLWGCFGLWCVFFDFTDDLGFAAVGICTTSGLHSLSYRVIKELKRQLALTTVSFDAAAPLHPEADEPATDE